MQGLSENSSNFVCYLASVILSTLDYKKKQWVLLTTSSASVVLSSSITRLTIVTMHTIIMNLLVAVLFCSVLYVASSGVHGKYHCSVHVKPVLLVHNYNNYCICGIRCVIFEFMSRLKTFVNFLQRQDLVEQLSLDTTSILPLTNVKSSPMVVAREMKTTFSK